MRRWRGGAVFGDRLWRDVLGIAQRRARGRASAGPRPPPPGALRPQQRVPEATAAHRRWLGPRGAVCSAPQRSAGRSGSLQRQTPSRPPAARSCCRHVLAPDTGGDALPLGGGCPRCGRARSAVSAWRPGRGSAPVIPAADDQAARPQTPLQICSLTTAGSAACLLCDMVPGQLPPNSCSAARCSVAAGRQQLLPAVSGGPLLSERC